MRAMRCYSELPNPTNILKGYQNSPDNTNKPDQGLWAMENLKNTQNLREILIKPRFNAIDHI